MVTNTAGHKSSNITRRGGTAGAVPSQKSTSHYNKAFEGKVPRVHCKKKKSW